MKEENNNNKHRVQQLLLTDRLTGGLAFRDVMLRDVVAALQSYMEISPSQVSIKVDTTTNGSYRVTIQCTADRILNILS